jgi:hypothetical protein
MGQWMKGGFVGTTRRKRPSRQLSEDPLITLPRARGTYVVFDAHAFRNAMNVLIARSQEPFTVLIMRPIVADATLRLADVVVGQLRAGTGDLAGYLEAAVAVMLHGAGRDGALRFRERAREAWRQLGGGELLVDMAEYPREEQRAIELLTTDWSAESWSVSGGEVSAETQPQGTS